MQKDSGIYIKELRVDGGVTSNNFLMQFQSDILQLEVLRPAVIETTSLGIGFLASLAVGFWEDIETVKKVWKLERRFSPKMQKDLASYYFKNWMKAVKRSKSRIKK